MTTDPLEQFSEALADRLAAASRFVVTIRTGRRDCSGILWRDDVVVTSEQLMPEGPNFTVVHNGAEIQANLAGCDAGHQRRRAAPGHEAGRRAAGDRRLPSPRLARPGRRRRCARRAHRAPRHGARHRPGMAQPVRRPHRGAAAARRASWRRRRRAGADARRPAARHVHLRPAPARAGDPGRHHRARARPAARPRAASPAAGSASGCSGCWCRSGCATRPDVTPA